jgi:glycosyltransferase involved in cell wall biosynthesis
MRLLISANSFHPSVGGYERIALLMAQQMHARGFEVRVVTQTVASGDTLFPFEVYRNPGASMLVRLTRWCDVYLQNNVSLKLLWPLLLAPRPLVIVHHGFYRSPHDTILSWRYRLKHLVTFFSENISVSLAVAAALPSRSRVCANPYRTDTFYRIASIAKERDLFFVGRLVSDKGVDLLIRALAELRTHGLRPRLTIAGSGPEERPLRSLASSLQLDERVTFAGRVPDRELNELLNAHRILVVPTRTGEGFGVVALEGIACGCVVVGSSDGGLAEAIGPCGRIFPKGDATALARTLRELLTHPQMLQEHAAHAKNHLAAHRPEAVAQQYVEVINQLAG